MPNYLSRLKSKLSKVCKHKPVNKIESYICKYLDRSKAISVIDIGAHRGDFVIELARYYRIHEAMLIEPIPDLANHLRLKFNGPGFRIIENGVSDHDLEAVDFKINVFGETSSILQLNAEMKELSDIDTRQKNNVTIITRTLDALIKEHNYNKIDLIKIDVQGVEHLVLKGGKAALHNTSYVWVETSFKPLYIGSSVFSDIYSLMQQCGFVLLEISPGHRSPSKELLQADVLFVNSRLVSHQ